MDNLSRAKSFLGRLAARDLDGALALAHDDATFRSPGGIEMDKAGLRVTFEALAPSLINPIESEIVSTTTEGNRVALEATFRTLLANGHEYANIYVFFFEFRDGKVIAMREYCDTARFTA